MDKWYCMQPDDVLNKMNSNTSGITSENAKQRLEKYGFNELIHKQKKSILHILFDQFKEIMVLILLIAAGVSFYLGDHLEGIIIIIIVILNTLIGFFQEFKAENAIAALQKLSVPLVKVRRNNTVLEISSKEVVPGDIILIEAGNIIPADARLITASNLKIQESTLTGESEPIPKVINEIDSDNVPIGDRKNMIFMGTVVTYGRGEAVVTETGTYTELGKIAGMLSEVKDEQSPLQKRLARLGFVLAFAALFLILIVIGISLFKKENLTTTFKTAISMAVAAVPEGLPAVVTIALALGAGKMLKRKSLIRNLPSVETLGSVTVICSDKTGTLTQNKMTVTDIIMPGKSSSIDDIVNQYKKSSDSAVTMTLTAGVLCNDAVVKYENNDYKMIGDPTEGSLIVAGEKINLHKQHLNEIMPRIDELPFSSDRKRMTTVHQVNPDLPEIIKTSFDDILNSKKPEVISFTKGSIDGIIELSNYIVINNEIVQLTDEIKKNILKQNEDLAGDGIRVLGFAFKIYEKNEKLDYTSLEQNMIYLGMAGMIDPIRPEVKDAVATCIKSGIRPIMITGDHPLTAVYIAKQLGITENNKFLTGLDLSKINENELKEVVKKINVYARVNPEHKMKLIDALQSNNQIVSMTGDGVNDAPALKSADIGVAMGITGTDVAKQSSDMVLLDDNFATIVSAVKEGRTIYDNIKRFIKYILTGNIGEILIMITGPLLGLPIPLMPLQILWINLVTDGAPGIAMGYEKSEKDIMNKKPYKPDENIFSRGVGRQILWVGVLIAAVSLAVGIIFYHLDKTTQAWQTMIFTTVTFCQMQFALCSRSNKTSIFAMNPFSNLILIVAVIATFGLQLCLIYIPLLRHVFETTFLTIQQLGICFAASFVVVIGVEIEKLILRLINND